MAAIQIRAMDVRVAPKLANKEPADLVVEQNMTVAQAVGKIIANLGGNQLIRLTLICHGFNTLMYGNEHRSADPPYGRLGGPYPLPGQRQGPFSAMPPAFCRVYGGYGLEWGKDNLDFGTVSAFAALKSKFAANGMLVIFGCAAADRGPDLGKLSGDGPGLMRRLAALTGATVRVSDSLQEVPVNWMTGQADRGAWSGRTFLFKPDGQQIDESKLNMSVY
jgi:hypothetical protein